MSFTMFVYLVSVAGAYKLGAYNSTHPGALGQWVGKFWSWMNK